MTINGHVTAFGLLVFLLVGSDASDARTAAQNRFTPVKSLTCVFPLYATGTWVEGAPRADVKPAKLSFRFEAIDTQAGTAELDSGFSRSHVVARLSERTLHFLLVLTAGPLYTTTVFDTESRVGKLKAVHTRHEYEEISVPGFTSRPEQYYGDCEVE